ncbi:MAG: type II secretion system F family protein, partial [Bdellovibrionales bacterium]|nr:type II secretion system F family protein [Bdellovibrionales bacterium]
TADEFISFKLINILVFPVLGAGLKALEVFDAQWYHIAASAFVGWQYPDFWVNGLIKGRQKKVKKAMPFIIDLLALSTEAGLDFVGAMAKVVEKAAPSPLVEEFGQVLKEIKVGSSRQAALREMAARVDMPEIGSFVAILISAEQMGASIGKILRQQSEMIRIERFVMAERAGAIAGQKLILPIVLIVLPAVMLMISAPFALQFLGGGG